MNAIQRALARQGYRMVFSDDETLRAVLRDHGVLLKQERALSAFSTEPWRITLIADNKRFDSIEIDAYEIARRTLDAKATIREIDAEIDKLCMRYLLSIGAIQAESETLDPL